MADSDRRPDGRVSRSELRSALAGGGAQPRRVPTPPRNGELSAGVRWDWSTDERSADDLAELRAALVTQRERVAELERDAARAHERKGELRGALGRLAAAGRASGGG